MQGHLLPGKTSQEEAGSSCGDNMVNQSLVDAGGADVKVGNETEPGVIALHSVSGKAEEEGDGDHHQEALFLKNHGIKH